MRRPTRWGSSIVITRGEGETETEIEVDLEGGIAGAEPDVGIMSPHVDWLEANVDGKPVELSNEEFEEACERMLDQEAEADED